MNLQFTLTFETLAPEEVLKRGLIFDHSKLTTMVFQKTNAATVARTCTKYNSVVKIKQEPVMAVPHSNRGTRKQPFKWEKKHEAE